ncbi:PREDICTED: trafficking protein particle complex subunit 11 [Ceratosolen solmsi marchali]|uniref:Trafficking protein particle complex subunit 11 n=1 Tax=Ceratosolen solmsi marchali TaxID=326594 RepID=A0AAJ6YEM3_9HYME|nr:PREDICTED: trafficking protein particle complex subunit 11 [Ceratosolen solmsi marchali]
MSDLPAELTARPLALIGLFGLDIYNSVHHSIWDAFVNNRRPDGAAVQFKLISSTHEFPTVKPKRNSYEWYIPKGILKRNWMNKYLNEVLAVIVVFYDLDWHDPQWNEKKMECASRVQSLRAALEGRNTKIAIVLIQNELLSPPGTEDLVATERATALCAACELTSKTLYFLPYADHLLGYTFRLEHVLYDLAQSFYHQEYRIVKSHREQLNKTAHQYLFVRHQFKMAFLNELKQDQNTAHKHYQQAYNNLLDIRMVDTNSLEIKTVASFINYKLSRLMFSLKLPKEAIAQFRSHVDRFMTRTGPKELMFEHHTWICTQYSIFAELFNEAIRQGLPAVQTQHPGYYFQMAANHALQRHNACKELCNNVDVYPDPDPLAGEEKLEFYGQRPWRPGKLNAEPADLTREAAAIQALQYKEKTTVNHSMIRIGLLGSAISQFKIYRCPRKRRLLVVEMAEEYFGCKDYGKVLTLLMHMLWEYRSERWPVLLTDVLKSALKAAYLSASIKDYLILALEALGPSTMFSIERKTNIFENIINILQNKPPNSEPNLSEDLKDCAVDKWLAQVNQNESFIFKIDDNMASFIDVKACFTQPKYTVNSTVTIEVFVRNLYHAEVELSKISVTVTGSGYKSEIPIIDSHDRNLIFSAKEVKKYLCQFEAPQLDDSLEIQINKVNLNLGNDKRCSVILQFSASGRETNLLDRMYPEIQQLRGGLFDSVRPLITAKIEQEESNVTIITECKQPALLGEWFSVKILVSSSDKISNVNIFVNLIQDNNSEQLTELSLNMKEKQSSVIFEIDTIEPTSSVEQVVFVRAHNVGDRNFLIKAEYSRCRKKKDSKEITYSFSVVKPFEVSTQFYTILYEPLTKGFIDEPLFIMPHIVSTSPWPIKIEDTSIELGNSLIEERSLSQESILKNIVLEESEAGTDVYCIVPKIGSEQPTSTGVYTIKWRRANDENTIVTSSSVTLTPLWVEDAVIGLETRLPPHGWVRTPLCVSYFIKNHSDYLITLRLTMEANEAFMFAGHKQIDICILPESEKKVEWILLPLIAGFVALPSLSLTVPTDEEYKLNKTRLAEVIERSIPRHVYIMPKSQTIEE